MCLVATGQRAAGQLSCQCCHLVQEILVSAHSLWKDLQTFCCSEGKCNFHDNSNLNCTLKVRGARAPVRVPISMWPGSQWAHSATKILLSPQPFLWVLADGGGNSDYRGVRPQYLQPLCPMRWRCPREHEVRVAPRKMILQSAARFGCTGTEGHGGLGRGPLWDRWMVCGCC